MSDEEEPIAVTPEDLGVGRVAQPGRALRHSVEDRLNISRRARDHSQNLTRGRLLLQGFGQGTLHVRIRRRWLMTVIGMCDGRPTPRAELSVRYGVVLLAPGTRHAEASQWPVGGRSEPWAETNCVGVAWSRTPGMGCAPGPLSGLSLSQFQAPCPPGTNTAPEPGDLLTVRMWHRECFVLWPHIHSDGPA